MRSFMPFGCVLPIALPSGLPTERRTASSAVLLSRMNLSGLSPLEQRLRTDAKALGHLGGRLHLAVGARLRMREQRG